jgi:heterodisulfide reductase subunit D
MTRTDRRVDLAHFTLRQMMELEACTRCGECIDTCPTFSEARNEEIHPLQKISRLKSFWKADHLGLLARLFGIRAASEEDLAAFGDGVYRCTLCARCHVVCPVQIDTRPLWISMREQLVDWGLVPEVLNTLRERVEEQHNISGDDNAHRLVWTQNMDHVPKGLDRKAGAETVYFMGCVGAMYPRVYGVPQSFVQILDRAGASFTTLGGGEWCCGFPLQIAGMGQHAVALASHNVEAVRAIGAGRLVTTCPSCYHTWAHEYPQTLGEPLGFDVIHASELLSALLDQDQLPLGPFPRRVTYHDPCDLGRTSGIYDAPRRILQAIPGIEFTEMADNRELSLCCGGGGDAEMADADLTAAVGQRRMEQAQAVEAEFIVTACQQCKRTLLDAARRNRIRIRTLDIVELLWASMQGS